jgi:multiple sugar transport system permease protein
MRLRVGPRNAPRRKGYMTDTTSTGVGRWETGGAGGRASADPAAVSRARRTRLPLSRRRSGAGDRRFTPWLYMIVPLVFLAVFSYIPVVNLFRYSLTSWDGFSPSRPYVGLKNYVDLFTRPELFEVFFVCLYYLAASVVQLAVALYFATVLSFDVKFRNFFKGIIFFPYLINGVAISFIFLYFFQPGGTLDSALRLIGIHSQHYWLGTPHFANVSLAGVSVWRYTGLDFVLFLGAIQSIPGEFYEAAEIDGASRWQQFRYIIAPGIKPIISLLTILAISGSISVFEVPFIMTGGSDGTSTFVIQTFNQAFQFQKVGLASAAAVVLLAIVLVVTWVQRLLVPDEKDVV